jgi:Uma2 family endonuclease
MAAQPVKSGSAPYTWSDYRTWPGDQRWEILAGTAYAMSPGPSTMHQQVAGRMFSRLERSLAGKRSVPFIAPTDVKLSEVDVVQPDILAVCEPSMIRSTHIEGAPDLVVEVLSPTTASRDLREKKALCERSGVREYVVIDPVEHYAIRFALGSDGSYDKGTVVAADEVLDLSILDGEGIPLGEVFGLAAGAA